MSPPIKYQVQVPHLKWMIAYNFEGCLFFVSLRKAIGYVSLTQNQVGFDGDSINL
jgi:hypothetical protein